MPQTRPDKTLHTITRLGRVYLHWGEVRNDNSETRPYRLNRYIWNMVIKFLNVDKSHQDAENDVGD